MSKLLCNVLKISGGANAPPGCAPVLQYGWWQVGCSSERSQTWLSSTLSLFVTMHVTFVNVYMFLNQQCLPGEYELSFCATTDMQAEQNLRSGLRLRRPGP